MAESDNASDAGLGNPAYKTKRDAVGRVPPRGGDASASGRDVPSSDNPNPTTDASDDIVPHAGLGNPAYNAKRDVVGRVPPRGEDTSPSGAATPSPDTRIPSTDASGDVVPDAGLGNPAYKANRDAVGRVPSRGADVPSPGGVMPDEPPPRRLRRLHRVWPDRDGNISYLLTLCVDGRARVLANETTFQRLVAFLLDSPARYRWFARRFVVMPDHIHLIAHQGHEAMRLGQWIKALKAVVGGLERMVDERGAEERRVGEPGQRDDGFSERPVGAPGLHETVGRVPPRGEDLPSPGATGAPSKHEFTRIQRAWRWQAGFHDHKFRTPEGEQRKWEYVCLNPVRYRLVARPEEWLFGGEIFYDEAGGPRLVRGTPPLLETSLLVE